MLILPILLAVIFCPLIIGCRLATGQWLPGFDPENPSAKELP